MRIEEADVAVKELAGLAARQDSSRPLILYSPTGQFDAQGALFYSSRPVIQAIDGHTAFRNTRYHNYEPLADLVTEQPSGIMSRKDEMQPLLADYSIDVHGESHDLIYATIRRNEPGNE